MKKISEPGLIQRGGGDVIHIDMSMWTTQSVLAKKLGVGRNVINNRVRRYMANGTIKTYYIEHLDIRLIPNVNNINELCADKKKL